MSVSELVKARADLKSQMDEIDDILGMAVEAVGAKKEIAEKVWRAQAQQPMAVSAVAGVPRPTSSSSFDRAFAPAPNRDGSQQVNVGDAPMMQPTMDSRSDMMSGFALWDADGFARQQAEASKAYLAQEQEDQQPQTEYDVESMQDEISTLKQEITQGIKDVQDTAGTNGGEQDGIPPIAQ